MRTPPPRFAERLLLCFINPRARKAIAGDFEEIYSSIAEEQGRRRANLWYYSQVLRSLPGFVHRFFFWSFILFRNSAKITWRLVKKHKAFSLINISGLGIGIACCLLSLLWVQDELSFDRFHENHRSLYRVLRRTEIPQGIEHGARTPAALADALKSDFPEVLGTARFLIDAQYGVKYKGNLFVSERVGIVDPSFLELFSFPLLRGDRSAALSDISNIVITERMASRLFGDEDPMGKVIDLGASGDLRTITGILRDIPHNSHLQFDILVPIDWNRVSISDWNRGFFYTFVQLRKGTDGEEFGARISGLIKSHVPESKTDLYLQPLTRIYFFSNNISDTFIHGEIKYTYIFSFMAVLMLLIACINFMNLSTARSSTRALEVGMRKVIGARRSNLIQQFLGESILFASLGVLLGLLLAWIALPLFNRLAEKNISIAVFADIPFALGLIGIAFLTGLVAGSYPALHLSRFQPIRILKNITGSPKKKVLFRKILVIVQFSLTIGLLTGTIIVHRQLNFIRNRNLGFDSEGVISMSLGPIEREFSSIEAELEGNPAVESVSYGPVPASPRVYPGVADVDWEGKDADFQFEITRAVVGYDYFKTFKMEIVKGRDFSREYATDGDSAFILNEAAVREMGLADPIGKSFSIRYPRETISGLIIGVVGDYHWASLRSETRPLAFHVDESPWSPLLVKAREGGIPQVISHLRAVWEQADPPFPFQYEFVDARIENLYSGERRIGTMFNLFTLIAVFISCLGLLGMALFLAEQKAKEIGIRKVLGASTSKIFILLSGDFVRWVLLANLFAWPLAYLVMSRWLRNFAYRIDVGIVPFLLSSGAALLIAYLTVSFQSIKSAMARPSDYLRYE